jgi:hypothetical protein
MYDPVTHHEQQLERILELTRTGRESAHAGDRTAVVAFERERRPLIRALFAEPIPVQMRVRIAAAIREILASDAALIAVAAAGRNDTAAESRKLRRGRSAAAAYVAAGRLSARKLPLAGKSLPLDGLQNTGK